MHVFGIINTWIRRNVMPTNLVSLVMQFLTPDMIGRIADGLGINRNMAQSAIAAAVPGLLAGFTGVAEAPGGAQKLADAAKPETGTLGRVTDQLGAGEQSSVAERGSQMLSSLMGAGGRNALTSVLGQFTGLGQASAGSLLGMLAPVVMGAIAHEQGSRGLDANGIANLLASQKNNIAAALPPGFGNLLSGAGLLGSLGGATRFAPAMADQTTRAAGSAGSPAYSTAVQRAAPRKWLYWLVPAAAIAGLLIYVANRPIEQETQQAANTGQNLTVNGRDVGKQVSDNVTNLHSTLRDVTDVESARAALPKLQDVTVQIDQVNGVIGQLTPEQRRTIAGIVNPAMPTFNALCEKALAIPGVSDQLKPTIDNLKVKLTRLTV
jgi:hypothetical protein